MSASIYSHKDSSIDETGCTWVFSQEPSSQIVFSTTFDEVRKTFFE
jgi:hypothetical protein